MFVQNVGIRLNSKESIVVGSGILITIEDGLAELVAESYGGICIIWMTCNSPQYIKRKEDAKNRR